MRRKKKCHELNVKFRFINAGADTCVSELHCAPCVSPLGAGKGAPEKNVPASP